MAGIEKQIIKNIGKLYYALLLTDDNVAKTATWAATKYLPGLREITVTPTENQGDIYAEGEVFDTDTENGPLNISLDLTDVPLINRAELLGHKLTATGAVIDNQKDEAPYIALMYEKTLKNGVTEYVTLYKGKLTKPEDKGKTREGNVEYQTKAVAGRFIQLAANGDRQLLERSDSATYDETAHASTWGAGKTITLAEPAV